MNITKINPAKVVRSYSGRQGCMCGCRGTYQETPASIKRVVNNMNKIVAEGRGSFVYDEEYATCVYIDFTDGSDKNMVVYFK